MCLKCISHTYRERDTLDAADGEAVVAGVAGAAEHLVTIHGADYYPFDATADFVLVSICELLDITTVFSNLLNGQLRNTHSQRYRSDWPRTTSIKERRQRHLLYLYATLCSKLFLGKSMLPTRGVNCQLVKPVEADIFCS